MTCIETRLNYGIKTSEVSCYGLTVLCHREVSWMRSAECNSVLQATQNDMKSELG